MTSMLKFLIGAGTRARGAKASRSATKPDAERFRRWGMVEARRGSSTLSSKRFDRM